MTAAPMSDGERLRRLADCAENFLKRFNLYDMAEDNSQQGQALEHEISLALAALRAPRKEQALGVIVEDATSDHGPGIRWNGTPPPAGTTLYASPNGGREERDEALEEAAKVADAASQKLWTIPDGIGVAPFAVADDIAKAIRALRAQPHVEGKPE